MTTHLKEWWASAGLVGPFTPSGSGSNDGFVRDGQGRIVADCRGSEACANVVAEVLNHHWQSQAKDEDGQRAEIKALRETLTAIDGEMDTVQAMIDPHLRGKTGRKIVTVEAKLTDLLTATCIASSVQQDIRVALNLPSELPVPSALFGIPETTYTQELHLPLCGGIAAPSTPPQNEGSSQ